MSIIVYELRHKETHDLIKVWRVGNSAASAKHLVGCTAPIERLSTQRASCHAAYNTADKGPYYVKEIYTPINGQVGSNFRSGGGAKGRR